MAAAYVNSSAGVIAHMPDEADDPKLEDIILGNFNWLQTKAWREETKQAWIAFWEDPHTLERIENKTIGESQIQPLEELFDGYNRVNQVMVEEGGIPATPEFGELAYAIGWVEGRFGITQEARVSWGGPEWPDG